MTRTITAILFALMTITVFGMALSCGRGTPPAPTEVVSHDEVGTWRWVMSIGGIAGDTIYADSVDYTRHLIFDADSNYIYLRNGVIESEGRYLIDVDRVITFDDPRLPEQVIDQLDADTLGLGPLNVVDSYADVFVRVVIP